ncbi:hypothetical protein ASG37_15695 [Sphingomonas sp. Leaf407]|uniref:hypothetical protein n=1 Tax=unclassified Sphingomonas TaxID=196159 RepID=UPI0006FA8C02|nr:MULTISPECIES: hypothetical protein [unclassified Sphingomonas]KQN34764.1 hypothetical protein ASE97_14950 [Sphingomonas sp. Leaf42]KQT25317.1 hypothetical protein ASG37_15695 [Sphingomonas sp. Leaf407]
MTETPDAFADRIAARFDIPAELEPPSRELQDLLTARHAALGEPLDPAEVERISSGLGLVTLVERIYAELLGYCPPALQQFCRDHVRVRGVRSIAIEGAVYSSGSGSYAVIVTTSLMILLSKIKKFVFAENHLDQVVYFNRRPAQELTAELARAIVYEIAANFRAGEARGPIVMLDERGSQVVHGMLDFQEGFIVGHELGHLLADHLLRSMLANGLHSSFGSPSHRSEYLADIIGYQLARRRDFDHDGPEPSLETRMGIEIARISSVCEFFEILELAVPGATETHPAPSDRIANVLATVYGEHFGAHYNAVRRQEIATFDWAPQFAIGVKPSFMGRLVHAMLTNERQIATMLRELAERGPTVLADIAARGAAKGNDPRPPDRPSPD